MATPLRPSGAACLAASLLMLSCGSSTSAPAAAGTSRHFFFAQVTDSHVGDGDGEQRLQQVVEALAALSLPIAFVVHTGDLAEGNAAQDAAKRLLDGLDVPVHTLPGNRDIFDEASARSFVARWGALSTTAEYEGIVFAFVYDQPMLPLGYGALSWLETTLTAAGEKPVVVFHHKPPVEDFYNNAVHPGWAAEEREAWTALLESHHVLADVTGHFHRDEQHFLGKVPLYVASSVSGSFGRQASFRVYEVTGEAISYRTIYIEP